MKAALNILSIALGVAVFLAIQIANHSAFRAFQAGVDMVAGKSHLEVRAADGRVDETVFPKVRASPGVKAATPVCEGFVTLPDHPGEYLRLLGIDLFTNAEFQTASLVAADASFEPASWLATPYRISLPESLADALGARPGDIVRAELDGRIEELTVAFVVADPPGGTSARTAAMDIGWCQELFGTAGHLASVQVILDDPDSAEDAKATLDAILPPGTSATAPAGRSEQIGHMLSGFQLNITALSMVSILVGMFLIYNTTSASVVRRRKQIGTLRALGASRGHVTWMFLREALLYGIAGVTLGVVGGILLARGLLGAVSETISAHYVLMSIDRAYLSPFAIGVAVVYGFAAVIAGAFLPAREAANTDPATALRPGGAGFGHKGTGTKLPFFIGVTLIVLSAICALISLHVAAPLSFAACFFLIVGFALVVPLASDKLASGSASLADALGSLLPGIAARSYRRSLHRTAVTTAALMVAVAMMVGVAVMISSFRGTVDRWVSMAMAADLFVAPAANEIVGLRSFTPPEVHDYLVSLPEVEQVDTYLELTVDLPDGGAYSLAAITGGTHGNFSFVGGGDDATMRDFFLTDQLILSEPLSAKLDKHAGDTLTLPTPRGDVAFQIAGIYYDYSDDNGRIVISRDNFDRHWDQPRYHSVAVYLNDGADPEHILGNLRSKFSQSGELAIYTNRSIRERIFEIFDQTFAVTYVLRTIAIIVAALGIALTLITLVAEREREIGVLRAVGAGRGQIRALYLGEAGLVGALGTLAGIVCGIFLAMLLTWVVNRAFFGWTIQFSIPWQELALTPLWTLPVAFLAGLIPADKASKITISKAIRSE